MRLSMPHAPDIVLRVLAMYICFEVITTYRRGNWVCRMSMGGKRSFVKKHIHSREEKHVVEVAANRQVL